MTSVEITYRRFFIRHRIKVQISSSFTDMTPSQFVATVRLSKGWIDSSEYFRQFFGMPSFVLKNIDDFYLYKLAALLEPLSMSSENPYSDFYLSYLPGGLKAPSAMLKGMSFGQFMSVDTFFSWYAYSEKNDYLDKFVASLYLRDEEDYFSIDMNRRLQEVGKIGQDLKYCIVVNWSLVKSWLGKAYPYLFPKGEPKKNSKGDVIKQKPGSWLSLFDNIVGENMPAISEYKRMMAMDAIRMINRRIKENRRQ